MIIRILLSTSFMSETRRSRVAINLSCVTVKLREAQLLRGRKKTATEIPIRAA